MRAAVLDAFFPFTDTFEGNLGFMYLDRVGLVTTGRGHLMDPLPGYAGSMGWAKPDGTPATGNDISAEWLRIKALQSIRDQGGMAYKKYATLFLSPADVDRLTIGKRDTLWAQFRARPCFRDCETWPADAQLGGLSMCWAMGAGFDFPKFAYAASQRDWRTCAAECEATQFPRPVQRNAANKTLFNNAKFAELVGDFETLSYPKVLMPAAGGGV